MFPKKNYEIFIDIDKEERKLIIKDNGIGMSKEDLEKFIEVAEELQQKYVNFTKEQYEQHEEFKLASDKEYEILKQQLFKNNDNGDK